MTVFSALYALFIGPLELFFDILYSVVYRIIPNAGYSIVVLSVAMNFLVLPLYRKADAMQEAQRQLEARLQPWVSHIKKTFKGDERFMILQTYYRQNGYKPTSVLRGSLSLLLEIPFFIAAYQFLSKLVLLNGAVLGPIGDLGKPDALLAIGSLHVNVLPILMTVINIISGAIYTKGFPWKSKLQLYGMALVFLVLLYGSPAGLVFYWTLNNVFSLCKNIFYKLKNPKKVLCILSSLAGFAIVAALFFVIPGIKPRRKVLVLCMAAALQLPLILYALRRRITERPVSPVTKTDRQIFYFSCIVLTLLTGLLIPTALMKGSAAEFVSIMDYHSPLLYVLRAFLVSAGLFLIWFSIFYGLAGERGKKAFGIVVLALAGAAIVNYMAYGSLMGTISSTLVLDERPFYRNSVMLANLLILAGTAGVLWLVWKLRQKLCSAILIAACISVAVMSGVNLVSIGGELRQLKPQLSQIADNEPVIRMSKTGKNVFILMLDRAMAVYTPYMFHERPELKEQFSGFTYYPHTISYGFYTNYGTPGLFGGYEYTPPESDERRDVTLVEKQNESLKVMPILFDESGYEVTICDPCYANYNWIPDLSIYDDYPQFHTYVTGGRYPLLENAEGSTMEHTLNRNMFCYSLMKISPLFLQDLVYNSGRYNEANRLISSGSDQIQYSLSESEGVTLKFADAYPVLKNLPQITDVTDAGQNTFTMMVNNTTHEPQLMQTPDYVPQAKVNNVEYDAAHTPRYADDGSYIRLDDLEQMVHYHVNMASMIQLGNWFDYLRECGVYDNTRIIIVADHGRAIGQCKELIREDIDLDILAVNPLLMVKDFNAQGFHEDDSFMTNADVPSLAMAGIVPNPINPFTGNPVDMSSKNDEKIYVAHYGFDLPDKDLTSFPVDRWYVLQGDPLDADSWSLLETE